MKAIAKKELTIGLAVIFAVACIIFGINYLKGVNLFKAANYYYTTFGSVQGLANSAPVKLNGFTVGLVREMNYDYANPGHVKVEMSLNKELKLPEGTVAVLVTDMLGTSSVDLHLGAGPQLLDKGSEIPGKEATGLMDALSSDVLPSAAAILPKVDSLLSSLNAIAGDPAIRASLQSIEAITASLETSSALLHSALAPMPGITRNAAVTMTRVDTIATRLNAMSADLAALSATLRQAPIDSVMANLNEMSANLKALTGELNSSDSSLGLLMTDPALYNNLNNCAAHIDSILLDLKKQPKRYIPSIKIF